jgi:hypothetical protein
MSIESSPQQGKQTPTCGTSPKKILRRQRMSVLNPLEACSDWKSLTEGLWGLYLTEMEAGN